MCGHSWTTVGLRPESLPANTNLMSITVQINSLFDDVARTLWRLVDLVAGWRWAGSSPQCIQCYTHTGPAHTAHAAGTSHCRSLPRGPSAPGCLSLRLNNNHNSIIIRHHKEGTHQKHPNYKASQRKVNIKSIHNATKTGLTSLLLYSPTMINSNILNCIRELGITGYDVLYVLTYKQTYLLEWKLMLSELRLTT
jgi:hypothetical protein